MAGEAIGASSILGLAFENPHGTYAAPTKYVPFKDCSLMRNQENYKRRVIRGVADQIGQVAGNAIVEGTLNMECLHDVLPYLLYAGRWDVVKTGTGPYTYTCLPNHIASVPDGQTLSVTLVRNGQVFGYTGVVVGSLGLMLEDNILMLTADLLGEEEASQSAPTASWPTSEPFGAGSYIVQLDDSAIDDFDGWSFKINNDAKAAYRVEGTNGASFIYFGERTVTLETARDFKTRADYDAYKALTSQKVEMLADNGTDSVYMELPSGIKQGYEIPISGQGELIQASITYDGVYDVTATGAASIIVVTDEDVVTA